MTTIPPPSDPRGQQWSPPPPGGYPVPLRGPRPRSVEISFWLWIISLILGAAGSVAALTQLDRIRAEAINRALAQNPTLDQSMTQSVVTGVLIGAVAVALLFVVAELVFVFLMRGGRNWARIVLAVFGGLSVLFGLVGLAGTAGPVLVASFVQLLLVVAAIATMFGPAANAWFRPRRPGF
jgi:hypothetical protein